MKRGMMILALIFFVHMSAQATDKESYLTAAEKDLKEWSVKVELLQKKAQMAGEKSRNEVDRDVAIVRHNIEIAQNKLTDVKQSNQSTWKKVRRGADDALHDVKTAYKTAKTYIEKSGQKD